ncbi:MAG: PQQ-like beta-propeller repeat protein [Prolixibacteraceae bacterium]|jgi:outer membrane protein assembly factor BamB|nr:PQQ-like beta-propeller repeat protein [Prolixibacteraceae bacterium]
MKTKTILFATALLFSMSVFAQQATVWRGGTDGIYPDTDLLDTWPAEGPEIEWVFEELGEGHSSPVFALDHIFISSMIEKDGYIFILDKNGNEVKRYIYGEEFFESYPGARSTPVIVGDWLYIYSGKGEIYAFDAMEGKLRWKKNVLTDTDGENIRWGVTETLVVDGDLIFSSPGGKIKNVIALNRMNGNEVWSSTGKGDLSAYCTPTILEMEGRKLLVTMMANHILGIDAKSGEMLWNFHQPNKYSVHANTPIYDNGLLVCTSGYGHGTVCLELAADGSSAKKVWFNEFLDDRMGGVVLLDGYLYASGDKNREWRCYDVNTGIEKWQSTEVGKGVIIAADNKLFMYSDRGELAMANATPEGFTLLGKTKVEKGTAQHWAHPVINNGKLYLHHGNALISYKIK